MEQNHMAWRSHSSKESHSWGMLVRTDLPNLGMWLINILTGCVLIWAHWDKKLLQHWPICYIFLIPKLSSLENFPYPPQSLFKSCRKLYINSAK